MKFSISNVFLPSLLTLFSLHLQAQWVWESLGKPMNDSLIEGILVDPVDEKILYATNIESGLYISRDGGMTWSHPLKAAGLNVESFQIDPSNPTKLYAGLLNELYFSADQGMHWEVIYTCPETIRSILVSKKDGSIFIAPQTASTNKPGIYKSEDGGKKFNLLPFGVSTNYLLCWDIEEDPTTGALYVAVELADHPQPYNPPFFRSLDGGKHWDETSGILPWHGLKLQVDPVDHSVYYLLERGGLYKSSDQAGTWDLVSYAYGFYMVLDPINPERIWVGDDIRFGDGGAYFSGNSGNSFTPIGPAGVSASYLSLNKNSTNLYVASYGSGIWRTAVPDLDAADKWVTTTADSGPNSLREVINTSNVQTTGSNILFAIPTSDPGYNESTGTWTIQLQDPLPALKVNGMAIDGASQSVYTGKDNNPDGPEIVLNGEQIATFGYSGIEIQSANNAIHHLNIQGFSGAGILIRNTAAHSNLITGNYIGTDATGQMARPNLHGIYIEESPMNQLGSPGEQNGNVLSGNENGGVYIIGKGAYGNRIQNNSIGVNLTGDKALSNGAVGINLSQSNRTLIGGDQVGAGNVISGNLNDGIRLFSDSNTVQGNAIGMGATGVGVIGNTWSGITVYGKANLIGGVTDAAANLLSGNGNYGINLTIGAERNVITGNLIGTKSNGEMGPGNGDAGIALVFGTKYNIIGPDNRIAYNPYGISCIEDTSMYNTFTQNSIFANTAMGISLLYGANGNIARPVIEVQDGSTFQGTSVANALIELFSDDEDEGKTYEGSVIADEAGHFEWTGSPGGPFLTVTATDPLGNTSIFSKPFQVTTVSTNPVPDPLFVSFEFFPNPVNQALSISYQLMKSGQVRIDLMSLRGELLRRLVDRNDASGTHTIRYPLADVPAGLYLLRFQAESGIIVKKMNVMH